MGHSRLIAHAFWPMIVPPQIGSRCWARVWRGQALVMGACERTKNGRGCGEAVILPPLVDTGS